MHWYKRNIGDYHKKAGRLTMLQHGSYTLLIDACYDREQFPTLDEALDWTWASTNDEIEAVTFVLKKFFTLVDGVYIQKRIADSIEQYQANADTNKRIAIERETKRKNKSTNREPSVNEAPPNQEPRTKEPRTIKKKSKPKESVDYSPLQLNDSQLIELTAIRKERKAGTFSQRVVTGLSKQFDIVRKAGYSNDDILNEWSDTTWAGFKAEWFFNRVGTNKPRKLHDFDDVDYGETGDL